MLFDSDHWNAQTAVPAPNGRRYLLTDGMPHLFSLVAGRRSDYSEEIALSLQYLDQHMTLQGSLQGSRPRIEDAVFQGHRLYAVAVATEAISQLPVPPARLTTRKWILILDLRDILLPFMWKLCTCDTIPVQSVIREFDAHRSPGFVTFCDSDRCSN